MTAVYRFQGASDDLIEVDGPDGTEEYNEASGVWRAQLVAPDGKALDVVARYGDNAEGDCWVLGVSPGSDGEGVPAWRYNFLPGDCSYSPCLVIEAPEGTRLDTAAQR